MIDMDELRAPTEKEMEEAFERQDFFFHLEPDERDAYRHFWMKVHGECIVDCFDAMDGDATDWTRLLESPHPLSVHDVVEMIKDHFQMLNDWKMYFSDLKNALEGRMISDGCRQMLDWERTNLAEVNRALHSGAIAFFIEQWDRLFSLIQKK